jgi:hypothetical protein
MQVDPGILRKPGLGLRPLVGGVVIHHQMQVAAGIGPRQMLESREELLVPAPVLAHGSEAAGGALILRRVQLQPNHVGKFSYTERRTGGA